MANKLKDIFSDDMFDMNNVLHFKDNEAYKNFLAALEIVQSEGRVVPVEGVTSTTTELRHNGMTFPLEEHTNISSFRIGPAQESVPITIDMGATKQTIVLLRTWTRDRIVLKSKPDSVVCFSFTLLPNEETLKVSYEVQFDRANSIEHLANGFAIATALLSKIFKNENDYPEKRRG